MAIDMDICHFIKKNQPEELKNYLLSSADNHCKQIENLYYNKPQLFTKIATMFLNIPNQALLDAFSDSCEQAKLYDELQVLNKVTQEKFTRHLLQLEKHADSIQEEIHLSQARRNLTYGAMSYPYYEAYAATNPLMSELQEAQSHGKVIAIRQLATKLKQMQTTLFPDVVIPSLPKKDRLRLLIKKHEVLDTLHSQDQILKKHRDFGAVILGNLASLLFTAGLPNIANKLVTGHFFFAKTPRSMQYVEKIGHDLQPKRH